MKRTHMNGVRARLVIVTLAVAALPTLAADPFEQSIPQNCILFATIRNVTELKAKQRETSTGKLQQDPAMRPFVSQVEAALVKVFDKLEDQIKVDIPKLLSIPSGQVSFAMYLPENPQQADEEGAVFFLADVTGHEGDLKPLLEQFGSHLEGAPEAFTRRTDGDLTVFSRASGKPNQQPAYALKNGVFAFSNHPEMLKKVVAKQGDGITANQRFLAFREKAGGQGDVEFFLDLERMVSILEKVQPGRGLRQIDREDELAIQTLVNVCSAISPKFSTMASHFAQPGASPAQVIQMLGLKAFKSAGVSLSLNKDAYEDLVSIIILTEGQSPLMDLFKTPAKPTKPESWIPAKVGGYASFNWDMDAFYAALTRLVEARMPNAMAMVDAQISQFPPDNPFVRSIKDDIIGPLGNRLTMVTDVGQQDGQSVDRMVFAWQLDDAGKLRDLIDRIITVTNNANGSLQTKAVRGSNVYTFDAGSLMAMTMPDPNVPPPVGVIGFTVTSSHFMFGTHIELLDQLLNFEGQAGLAESPNFARVAEKLPANVSALFYADGEANARSSWQLIKTNQLRNMMKQAMENAAELNPKENVGREILMPLLDALDGEKLPDFDAVKKYFANPTGGYMIQDERGITVIQFSLKS